MVISLVAMVMLSSPCKGQSASNFDTTPLTPKPLGVKKEKSAGAPVKEVAPVSTTPSRFVGDTDLDAYVQSLAAIFTIRDRSTDPFGQVQDPDAKPIIKQTLAKASRRITQVQVTPFPDIIRLLKVTTIMPMEKRFLVGTRSIKQGQCFPISFRTKNINVEVVSVSSQQIQFRNMESGEIAELSLNLLPAGMTPGTQGITAPGMVKDVPNAPIELEGGTIPTDNAQNANP